MLKFIGQFPIENSELVVVFQLCVSLIRNFENVLTKRNIMSGLNPKIWGRVLRTWHTMLIQLGQIANKFIHTRNSIGYSKRQYILLRLKSYLHLN